mmetsp:Transcript_106518/g.254308  ORF Transcript_106518/g.254308 Transcript_106518/m.254308 type:complete len:89 (+) Transcript_106518:365-631(+)
MRMPMTCRSGFQGSERHSKLKGKPSNKQWLRRKQAKRGLKLKDERQERHAKGPSQRKALNLLQKTLLKRERRKTEMRNKAEEESRTCT